MKVKVGDYLKIECRMCGTYYAHVVQFEGKVSLVDLQTGKMCGSARDVCDEYGADDLTACDGISMSSAEEALKFIAEAKRDPVIKKGTYLRYDSGTFDAVYIVSLIGDQLELVNITTGAIWGNGYCPDRNDTLRLSEMVSKPRLDHFAVITKEEAAELIKKG